MGIAFNTGSDGIDLYKKNEKVMIVEVKNCEFQGAQGPFTVKDVDIFAGATTLKETNVIFGTDGVRETSDDDYMFLTPVKKIVKVKK